MNPVQEKFFNSILSKVTLENQPQAKALIKESFSKQTDSGFNKEYIEEVTTIMTNHKA